MKGSVFKRREGDERWSAHVDVGRDENGKRLQRTLSNKFKTEAEAWRWVRKILSDVDKGDYVHSNALTVGHYLDEWLPGIKSQVKPSTWASYASYTNRHLIPKLGSVPLQALKATHLKRLYSELAQDGSRQDGAAGGLSTRSIRYIHAILRLALTDAVKEGLVQKNVALLVDAPRLQQSEMKTWTGEQAKAFLTYVQNDRLAAAWALALSTGLRKGELLGLRWQDVDLDTGRLAVNQTLISVGYKAQFSTPKTDRGKRSIDLDPETAQLLRSHRARQAEERLAWGPAYQDSGLVFTRETGEPIHPESFSSIFERLVKGSGVPRIRLHDCRHTFASLALAEGINPLIVSRRLGHSSVAFTLDVYGHEMPGDQMEAAKRVAGILYGSR